jgi:carbon monoxide dehydrogenase subunit G
MKIEGQFLFENLAGQAVWNFLTNPDRIATCLPGCEKLIPTGDGTYDMTLAFGVGAIRGNFSGSIRLHDVHPTSDYGMTVSGSGAVGFVNGEGTLRLMTSGEGTTISYSGDVSAGGAIASVGQRMISGAARMVIDQFFKCVVSKLQPLADSATSSGTGTIY